MNEKNQTAMTNEEVSIDFVALLQQIWKQKFIIILLAVVFGALFLAKSLFFTDDTYTSVGRLFVSSRSVEKAETDSMTYQDLQVAKGVTPTYIELLKQQDFLELVSKKCNSQMDWKSIRKMLSVVAVGETELITISVTDTDPDVSCDIASTLMKYAPEYLSPFYDGRVIEVTSVHYPELPNSRGTAKNTVIGILIGLFLGLVYAFLQYLLDTKIHNSADITKKYGVSILGELAGAQNPNAKKNMPVKSNLNIINSKSSFDTIETYKSIRTNIMFSIPKTNQGKVVVVTSPAPSEGKTTTAINLALTFAQTGARILLLDCDLRKPRIHRYLQIERGVGISNVLCGFTEFEKAINVGVRENLDVITAGEIPPNPAELLENDEFGNTLSYLKERYDYIFVDTPPTTVVTDAMVAMRNSEGVVVVVRENVTTFDTLNATLEDINKVGKKVLGCVVLDSSEHAKKYGYYKNKNGYRNKYGYKYGYRYGYKYAYANQYAYKDDENERAAKAAENSASR